MIWNWLRGKETATSLRDRLGWGAAHPSERGRIWLHGASVGELQAARHLIETLLDKTPHDVIVTANSATGQAMVEGWAIPRVAVARAPADAFGATGRFLSRWDVRCLISLENELWPNRISTCKRRNIPVFGAATRTPKAAETKGWKAGLIHRTLARYTRIWPQTVAHEKALTSIVGSDTIGPIYDAKATVETGQLAQSFPADLQVWQGRQIILAASTHAPEERLLAKAFQTAIVQNPDLRLIIAPRHPERGGQIARSLESHTISMACRSEGEVVADDTTLYIADTLHEMGKWYAAADWTIIGGTFAPKGGHTPVEPILAGSVPAFGPDMRNHQDIADTLIQKGAALQITDEAGLVAFMSAPDAARDRGEMLTAGQSVLAEKRQRARDISQEIASAVMASVSHGNP